MDNNPVGWFEIYVDDMKRARSFYEKVFQVTLTPGDAPGMEMWFFSHAMGKMGAGGALVRMEGVCSGANSTVVYFNCDNCAQEESRVVKSGGKIFKGKFPIGEHGFIALVNDSEGNLIGLHSMK